MCNCCHYDCLKHNPLLSLKEVIQTVIKADGVQHLISMATSEHVIMQNEALVALAIASAIDIGETMVVSHKTYYTIYTLYYAVFIVYQF